MTNSEFDLAWQKRMQFHCKRGLLEIEVLLQSYAQYKLPVASVNTCQQFEALLKESDQQLFEWLLPQQFQDASQQACQSEEAIPAHFNELIKEIRDSYLNSYH